MSERCMQTAADQQQNKLLSNPVCNLNFFLPNPSINTAVVDVKTVEDHPYDHMYATNNGQNGIIEARQDVALSETSNCQTSESEVNFLKQFLLIHLDLIQQQNDDILNKENTIFLLKQENARLKERIDYLERGATLQCSSSFTNTPNSPTPSPESLTEDMTQGTTILHDENIENNVHIPNCTIEESNAIEVQEIISDNQDTLLSDCQSHFSPIISTIAEKEFIEEAHIEVPDQVIVESTKSISEYSVEDNTTDHSTASIPQYTSTSYTVHQTNTDSSDPMKNLRMSIRRKRLCSNSSAFSSNTELTVVEEKKTYRRAKKRRKRSIVNQEEILTHPAQYVNQVGDSAHSDILRREELAQEAVRLMAAAGPSSSGTGSHSSTANTTTTNHLTGTTNLEVPRWRVKVYTSCYTMEGTENLDDEVYTKRHQRHENDERRRKRWDVQRIREQRMVEKLKQRQEKAGKVGNSHRSQPEPVESLWPCTDEVKCIDMSDELPVSAFGCHVPKITPNEFSLPWLTSTENSVAKKLNPKRSIVRRKGSKN